MQELKLEYKQFPITIMVMASIADQ